MNSRARAFMDRLKSRRTAYGLGIAATLVMGILIEV